MSVTTDIAQQCHPRKWECVQGSNVCWMTPGMTQRPTSVLARLMNLPEQFMTAADKDGEG